MRRRTLIIIALALFFCLSVPALAVYWLCYTQTGLQWLAARVSGMQKVRLEFHGLTGQLRGPIHIDRFELDQERVHVIATNVTADLHLRRIFLQTIETDYLNIANLQIRLKPRTTPPTPQPPHFLPQWLRINAHAVSVPEAKLILTSGREFEAGQVRTAAILTSDRLKVSGVSGAVQQLTLGGDATLYASQPLRMKGAVAWTYATPDQPRWAGQVQADGDLDRLLAKGSVTEPLSATFDGQLLDLTQAWHWEAAVQAQDFTLKPWSPQSPVNIPSANLTGRGGGDQVHISGTLLPKFPETGPLNVTLEGRFAQRALHADVLQVSLESSGAALSTSGDIAFLGGWPQLNLTGNWTALRYPFLGKTLIQSKRGEFTLDGKVPYRYTVSADVAGWSKTATISSQGLFDRDAITWDDLRASILGGRIQSNGSLGFGGNAPWKVSATAQDLAPQQLDERFPGQVGFELDASGRGFDRSAQVELRLRELRGQLREQPLGGHAHLRLAEGTLKVDDTDLSYGTAHLQAHGDYGARPSFSWDLNVPDFAQLLPDTHGSLQSRGTLSGTRAEPQVSGTLSALKFEYGAYQVARLEAQAKVDLADRSASQLQVSASALKWGMRELNSLDVTVDGRASAHQVSVKADAEEASLSLRVDSEYADETLSGTVTKFDLNLGDAHLRLASPTRFSASREHAGLEQLCLNGAVEHTCAQGEWRRAGPWKVALEASGLPLKVLGAGLPRQSQYSGVLSMHAKASADAGKHWIGEAQAALADGVFRYQKSNGKIESVTVGSGEAHVTAASERFDGTMRLSATEAAGLNASVSIDRRASADWKAMPLTGKAHAEMRELGFLPILFPQVDRATGHLTSDVELGGTLGTPEINGSLAIDDGALDSYVTNMQLRDLKARVELKGNGLTLTASVRAGSGTATLDGKMEWRDRAPHGRFRFKGTDLELVNVPEAQVRVSPDLRFRIEGREIGVDGAVRIPKALLAPADLSKATLASSDEIIVGSEEPTASGGFQVSAGILIALGNDVRVDSYGLKARVEGNITASAAPNEVSTAIGELEIAEDTGKYSAYTRELDIEQGRLIFSGGPVSDPGVDLRASKEFPEAKVGVNVRGTLRNPRLTFWSDPPLPQTQIASMIFTGGKLEDAQNPGGAPSSSAARTQALAQGSALLASQLGQQLGLNLEDVRVETGSNAEAQLVLGRYLSPRFYVSYGISFTEALNTLKLRYTINDKWTIKSEAGENRSLDLEFKIER
jgi:translocation and assembly module TamB